jgi:YidC/Oxa1 family membrane protein insertase
MEKMDKHKLLGIILFSCLFILYTYWFEKPATSAPSIPTQTTTVTNAPNTPTIHPSLLPYQQGKAEEVTLENDNICIVLTSQGAQIKSVTLKHYKDYQGEPLRLIDESSHTMEFQFTIQQHPIRTSEIFFDISDTTCTEPGLAGQVTFTRTLGSNQSIRQVFSLPQTGYSLSQTWSFEGFKNQLDQNGITFSWHDRIKRTEQDIEACRNKSTINYYLADKNFDHLKEQSEKVEEKTIKTPIQWIAIKQRFFTAGILADETPFPSACCILKPTSTPETTVKEASIRITLPTIEAKNKGTFKLYFGPNSYQDLKSFTTDFTKNLPLGWAFVKWINQYLIIPVFDWISNHVTNYGIAILLLVVFIKLLLLPLSYKSYVAMAEMKVIKPALEALKEKYGKNMQQIQMEQLKLYREMGINPLSGCIPVLLQLPILLAMFNFFPNAIELRQQGFLWAPDLSTYDAIINLPFTIPLYGNHISLFTLLMTLSTLIYTWSNNQVNMPQGPMKTMSYIFPIGFMLILNKFPAGLNYYYFVSNLLTFGQQTIIKRLVNEDKLKEKLEKNRIKLLNKDVPFKERLQQAMKSNRKNSR